MVGVEVVVAVEIEVGVVAGAVVVAMLVVAEWATGGGYKGWGKEGGWGVGCLRQSILFSICDYWKPAKRSETKRVRGDRIILRSMHSKLHLQHTQHTCSIVSISRF